MGPLVILGCGFTGAAAARLALARGHAVVATTRDPARAAALRALGVDARALPALDADAVRALVPAGARVLVAFPPDGRTDAFAAAAPYGKPEDADADAAWIPAAWREEDGTP